MFHTYDVDCCEIGKCDPTTKRTSHLPSGEVFQTITKVVKNAGKLHRALGRSKTEDQVWIP